jgi:hypothetical protein
MIKLKKSYVVELTEQQAKELYELLRTEKDRGCLTIDKDLVLVYNELKNIFGTEKCINFGINYFLVLDLVLKIVLKLFIY